MTNRHFKLFQEDDSDIDIDFDTDVVVTSSDLRAFVETYHENNELMDAMSRMISCICSVLSLKPQANQEQTLRDMELRQEKLFRGILQEVIPKLTIKESIQESFQGTIQSAFEETRQGLLGDMRLVKDSMQESIKGTRQDILGDMRMVKDSMQESIRGVTEATVKDAVRHTEDTIQRMHLDIMSANGQQATSVQTSLQQQQVQIKELTDHLKEQSKNTKAVGAKGEQLVYDLLVKNLKTSQGYSITHVGNRAQCCDLLIERRGKSNIRVEVKSYTHKVNKAEVEKFHRDLIATNDHGIFISLYSGIVGVASVSFERMPTGKFAVYLTNEAFSEDSLYDFIELIYKVDESLEDNHDMINISAESMKRIREHLDDWQKRVQSIKVHCKEIVQSVEKIDATAILTLLAGGTEEETVKRCRYGCGKTYRSGSGLFKHEKVCPKRPVEPAIAEDPVSDTE